MKTDAKLTLTCTMHEIFSRNKILIDKLSSQDLQSLLYHATEQRNEIMRLFRLFRDANLLTNDEVNILLKSLGLEESVLDEVVERISEV